ncbi:leucoanthocyanidin reductase-like isoform X2 [Malus sylvestris]|uniref:leucoanthocyanidin reductase-like isoform X2 n=1 Tax=Malus sylvestris TaxID=3752 RepID=UPI0021AC89A0|nr:leucoanthocyanidin reductase-like isoform X2 [Malus sylvestris]
MCGTTTPNVSDIVKHRTLIIGSTGFIGRFVAEASLHSGHPTYLLVRPGSVVGSSKSTTTIGYLQERGAIVLTGSIDDQDSMEKVLKEHKIEVVVSVVGGARILDQLILLEAIKAVGTVKRFLPSEFGHDIDRADPVEPGLTMYNEKRKVRRATEAAGIPYTYICCNSIAGWPYHDNIHPADVLPPLDRFHIYGDGTVKEMIIPQSIVASFTHDIFIKGCQVNYDIENPNDIEVCSLYPDTPFQTVEECFKDFATRVVVVNVPKVAEKSKSNDFIVVPNAKPEALVVAPASA